MKQILLVLVLVVMSEGLAFGGAKTGDISIDSEVDSVVTVGTRGKTETNVHSVEVHEGYSAGNIVIQGKASNVTNINTSDKDKVYNRGSVIIGPKK